ELDRLMPKITTLLDKVNNFQSTIVPLAGRVGITPEPVNFNEAEKIVQIANLITQAPKFEEAALINPVWSTSLNEIKSLIEQGVTYQNDLNEIKQLINDEQVDTPLLEFRDELQTIPEDLLPDAFSTARALLPLIPQIQLTVNHLTKELGTESLYRSSQEIKNLIE
ncbi:hypothetical protein, partial [Enterobacter sichuanensis]